MNNKFIKIKKFNLFKIVKIFYQSIRMIYFLLKLCLADRIMTMMVKVL